LLVLLVVYLALCLQASRSAANIYEDNMGNTMAENMNGLGSKTKYEYPMAKARDEVKSMFDFFGYTDPTPEYQKSPEIKPLFDLDSILPPLPRILEKYNSKLQAVPTKPMVPLTETESVMVNKALSYTGNTENTPPKINWDATNSLVTRPITTVKLNNSTPEINWDATDSLVTKPITSSVIGKDNVDWGGDFREEFASYRDASETYINNLSPEYSNDERVTIPRPTFNLDEEEANLSIETTDVGFKYKNNNAAIDAMLRLAKDKYGPLQVAALQATMEAESSHDLVEDTRYSYNQAIKKFGDSTRKPLIDALYNGRTYLPPADQKTLFDIAYAQPGNDRLNAPNEGWLYRGRGPIQITGKNNYSLVGEAMGIGDALVKNPDLLISDPKILAAATLAYLDINGFGENTTSRKALYNVIRHAGGANGEDAKKRWERTEEIMKSNTSPTESSQPRSRPEGITTVGKRAPTDSPLAPASSPRPKPRPNSVASNTQKVTSALAERTKRPNSNQGF
jgi:predicted chitinase